MVMPEQHCCFLHLHLLTYMKPLTNDSHNNIDPATTSPTLPVFCYYVLISLSLQSHPRSHAGRKSLCIQDTNGSTSCIVVKPATERLLREARPNYSHRISSAASYRSALSQSLTCDTVGGCLCRMRKSFGPSSTNLAFSGITLA
jgi:hypothetical protein